jgi:hypothetical protein
MTSAVTMAATAPASTPTITFGIFRIHSWRVVIVRAFA